MSDQMSSSVDAVIVGAGFAGLYMLHRLRGIGVSARIYEAGSGVGGTWFWNRYPGARCDVESLEYCYTFSEDLDREWQWSERYASQPEILRYLNYVADRFDLRRDIELNCRVMSVIFNESTNLWNIQTDRYESVLARFCIMATGCLSAAKVPDYPGLEKFQGKWYHTGNWPQEGVNFTGKKVGVIGTGSSGVQSIPLIAEQASDVYVFQRTATFSIPAHNASLSADALAAWNEDRAAARNWARTSGFGIVCVDPSEKSAVETSAEERQRVYEERWQRGGFAVIGSFSDLIINKEANDTIAEFVRAKIREIVSDPAVAEKLTPKDYPLGTKRMCVDSNYYATFNRKNVTLVDLRATPIEEITASGIRTSDRPYALDNIVFATGFDAMTGALSRMDIRGRAGLTLKQKWAAGPCTYLGLMVGGFPNLFTITGPGSPSVLSNRVISIEQHADWIADCLTYLRDHHIVTIEASLEAENDWVNHVNEVANYTLFPRASSWYVGANIPGKPRVFMPYVGGVGVYRQKCSEIAACGYAGFDLSAAAAAQTH